MYEMIPVNTIIEDSIYLYKLGKHNIERSKLISNIITQSSHWFHYWFNIFVYMILIKFFNSLDYQWTFIFNSNFLICLYSLVVIYIINVYFKLSSIFSTLFSLHLMLFICYYSDISLLNLFLTFLNTIIKSSPSDLYSYFIYNYIFFPYLYPLFIPSYFRF